MKLRLFLFCFLSVTLLLPTIIAGQAENSELDNTKISILTCRSGDELYTTFGHTAIRVFNPTSKIDYVYNYGLFSFDTPNFYPKFMRGQLPYFLGVFKMSDFIFEYDSLKRSVFEQELILDNDQKQKIIKFLMENLKPENREYKYDFFFDNCATRVIDVWSLVGDVSYEFEVEKKTFRDLLKENLRNLVWSDFGIDLVIGQRADRLTNRRDQMFLPEYVMANLSSATVDSSRPLAKEPKLVLDYEEQNSRRKKKATNWPFICTILLLIVTVLINVFESRFTPYYNKTLLILSGVLGLFLLFMWFGTNHGATRDNWNVMWLNPIALVFLMSKHKLKLIIGYVYIILLGISSLNCLFTFLPQFFNIGFLPMILSILVVMIYTMRIAKANKSLA